MGDIADQLIDDAFADEDLYYEIYSIKNSSGFQSGVGKHNWRMGNGDIISMWDMELSHLENALRYNRRKGKGGKQQELQEVLEARKRLNQIEKVPTRVYKKAKSLFPEPVVKDDEVTSTKLWKAHCKAFGTTTEEQIQRNLVKCPDSYVTPFVEWNMMQIRYYASVNPDAFTLGNLTDHAAYEAWLEKEY